MTMGERLGLLVSWVSPSLASVTEVGLFRTRFRIECQVHGRFCSGKMMLETP